MSQKIIFILVAIITIPIINAFGAASCPDDTNWDGQHCIKADSGKPITFTDYSGSEVKKSENKVEIIEEITNAKPPHETLAELMIVKPEIQESHVVAGHALEQKKLNDKMGPTNMTRENYYFKSIIEWSTKNAASTFNKIVFGKDIQNHDFGKNNEKQIEYSPRFTRSEDILLQQDIVNEGKKAQMIFLINWGNFTNH